MPLLIGARTSNEYLKKKEMCGLNAVELLSKARF